MRQVRTRTKALFGMSRPGSSGRRCLAPFRVSRNDGRTKVSSHPSRIGRHVKPAYGRPTYSSIKAPGRHPARGGGKRKETTTDLLVGGYKVRKHPTMVIFVGK